MSEMQTTQTTSLLAGVQGDPAPAPATQQPAPEAQSWRDSVKEKFRTYSEDKTSWDVNTEGLVKSYNHLEQRLGKGLPAESVDALTIPEQLAEFASFEQPEWADLRNKAFEMGMNPQQFALMAETMAEMADGMANEMIPDPMATLAELQQIYGGEKEANQALALANRAAKVYGEAVMNDPVLGNHPEVIKMLAAIGKELGQDGSVKGVIMSGQDLATLKAHPAYMDTSHPEHGAIRARVRQHYVAAKNS